VFVTTKAGERKMRESCVLPSRVPRVLAAWDEGMDECDFHDVCSPSLWKLRVCACQQLWFDGRLCQILRPTVLNRTLHQVQLQTRNAGEQAASDQPWWAIWARSSQMDAQPGMSGCKELRHENPARRARCSTDVRMLTSRTRTACYPGSQTAKTMNASLRISSGGAGQGAGRRGCT
jgi:hypothetical protein